LSYSVHTGMLKSIRYGGRYWGRPP
jgi:hypothetical protein